jgi:ubiquitin carboxyl-terminal hydrolase 14
VKGEEAKQNAIDYLFGGEMTVVTKCKEESTEPPKTTVEPFRKLRCHIAIDTNYLQDGIKKDLEEDIELRSAALGRTALYTKSYRISKMPRYLIVQFVRFFWKNDTKQKAKILKKVTYPIDLDVYDFCSDKLKTALSANRRVLSDEKDAELGLTRRPATDAKDKGKKDDKSKKEEPAKTEEPKKDTTAKTEEPKKDTTAMDTTDDKNKKTDATTDQSKDAKKEIDTSITGPTTGRYSLFGVVTHQGRSADGGHYIGWVRKEGDTWLTFDDDKVSTCTTEDVKKLSGGGDWHMTYVCMYQRIDDLAERAAKLEKAATASTSSSNSSSSASSSSSTSATPS